MPKAKSKKGKLVAFPGARVEDAVPFLLEETMAKQATGVFITIVRPDGSRAHLSFGQLEPDDLASTAAFLLTVAGNLIIQGG